MTIPEGVERVELVLNWEETGIVKTADDVVNGVLEMTLGAELLAEQEPGCEVELGLAFSDGHYEYGYTCDDYVFLLTGIAG